MGLLGRHANVLRTAAYLQKASPIFVHLFMILGVALYTLFGAVVMRSLESKTIEPSQRDKRFILSNSNFTNFSPQNHSRDHEIRHFSAFAVHLANGSKTINDLLKDSNNTAIILGNSRTRRELAHVMRSRRCVLTALQKFIDADCSENVMQRVTLKLIDDCYHTTIDNHPELQEVVFEHTANKLQLGGEQKEYIKPWSFSDSILFAFTVITTIGYGNVAPRTLGGRIFVILYGLIGIPFTLLAIADLGKFISEVIDGWEKTYRQFYNGIKKRYRDWRRHGIKHALSLGTVSNDKNLAGNGRINDEAKQPLQSDFTRDKSFMSTTLEAQDTYANAITEDTDFIDIEKGSLSSDPGSPKSQTSSENEEENNQAVSLLIFFGVYMFCGSAILSSYEPDMSFFKAIYFNFVSLSSIGLGDIYPKSETYMAFTIVYIAIGLALTTIAIEIAADTLKKLHYYGRKIENVGNVAIWFGGKKLTMKQLVKNLGDQFNLPVTTIKDLDLDKFVDNAIKVEEGVIETLRPPPLEPADLMLESNVTYADDEKEWIPQKTPTPTPPPKTPTPEPTPPRTPTPPPKTPTPPPKTPTPPPKTPTPPPKTPTPPPKTPTPPPKTPTPPPKTPTPPPRTPTPEPEPEPEPPKGPTAAELAAQKRRAYSEEAWRRYQEYQKQWKKFRQTKNVPKPPKDDEKEEHAEQPDSKATSPVPPSSAGNSRPSSSLGNRSSISSSTGAVAAAAVSSSLAKTAAVRGSHSPMGSRLPVKKPTTSVSRSQTSSASSSRAASPRKSESPSRRIPTAASRGGGGTPLRPQRGTKPSTPKSGSKEKAEEELDSSKQTTKDIVQKRRKMYYNYDGNDEVDNDEEDNDLDTALTALDQNSFVEFDEMEEESHQLSEDDKNPKAEEMKGTDNEDDNSLNKNDI